MTSRLRAFLATILLVCLAVSYALAQAVSSSPSSDKSEQQLLNALERAHFNYFVKYSDPKTGLTMDSSKADSAYSIAAVGFSLSSYVIASKRAYTSRPEAAKYVLKTLRTLWALPQGPATKGVSGYHGFFYHFLDKATCARTFNCELSSIDTALLIAGVLSCQTYFDKQNSEETEIRALAQKLYNRVEWDWMFRPSGFICMGWHPEVGRGYHPDDWSMYCEGPILILLAAGSPTHPLPAQAWTNYCQTFTTTTSFGKKRLNFAATYGYQYPGCWIDFRGINDAKTKELGFDYFENARRTLLAQHAYAIANPLGWKDYGKNCWGLTACHGPGNKKTTYHGEQVEFRGYSLRGCPNDFDDGTIAPTAIAASIPYAPELVIPTLKEWRKNRPEIWGGCGFRDAFNPSFDERKPSGWVDSYELAIDQGPIAIMIENYRSGLIWDLMKRNDALARGLKRSGFSGGWLDKR